MLKELGRLIKYPSVTGTEATKGVLEEALKICDELGFKTKNLDGRIGYAEIGEGEEIIGILCHLDVVPVGTGWETDPFELIEKDGVIFGRGVSDDKGPCACAMFAMKDVLDSGVVLNKRVRLIMGTMEEGGNWQDMAYYREHEELPTCGFTPDADFPAIYGEKGIAHYKLTMPLEKSGFKEVSGGEAVNMVAPWAKAVLDDGTALETKGVAAHGSLPFEGKNAISALMDEAAKHDCHFAKVYMEKIGYCLDGTQMGLRLEDKESGKATFCVGKIGIVGDNVELQVDIRCPVTIPEEEVTRQLRESMKKAGIEVELFGWQHPVYMAQDGPVISKLLEAYSEVTGQENVKPLLIGGGTYARAMDNIVAFGSTFPWGETTEHQANEHVRVEDLEKARKIYGLAIKKLIQM